MGYRQALEKYGISIEQQTPSVSSDGYYYVIRADEVVGRHRTLKAAQRQYESLKQELGVTREKLPRPSSDSLQNQIWSQLSNRQLLWTEEDYARFARKTQGKKGTRSAKS